MIDDSTARFLKRVEENLCDTLGILPIILGVWGVGYFIATPEAREISTLRTLPS